MQINIYLDGYEEIAEYQCPFPNCERIENKNFNEIWIEVAESWTDLKHPNDDFMSPSDFENFDISEDLCQETAFMQNCRKCHRDYQVKVNFDCAGSGEFMFQDREHYYQYLAGDA